MIKYPALSLFILLDSDKNYYLDIDYKDKLPLNTISKNNEVLNINPETILAYQIGRFKKYFKQIFLIIEGKNKYSFLGVPVFSNKFVKYRNLGKIFTGLLKTRFMHNVFLQYDLLSFNMENFYTCIKLIKGYSAVLPKYNEMLFSYGLFRKDVVFDIIPFLEKATISEIDVLKKFNVNYINI